MTRRLRIATAGILLIWALAMAAVFTGSAMLASAAHGAQERGQAIAELSEALERAEERERAHRAADRAMMTNLNGGTEP